MPPLFTSENLYIYEIKYNQRIWLHIVDITLWLELPIYRREEFPPTRESCAIYRASPARACWRQNDRGPRRKYSAGWETPHMSPILPNVFLEDLQPSRIVQEGIKQFAPATGHLSPDRSFSLG